MSTPRIARRVAPDRPDLGRRRAVLGTACAVVAACGWPPAVARGHSYKLGDIAVGHLWAPPPEDGADGLPVYGPLLNRGDASVRLIGVSSPLARQARFRLQAEGETRWPAVLELPPMRPLALAAWREHIWVSGLKRPLRDGERLPLALDFGPAGTLEVDAVIEETGGH